MSLVVILKIYRSESRVAQGSSLHGRKGKSRLALGVSKQRTGLGICFLTPVQGPLKFTGIADLELCLVSTQ